MVDSGGTDRHGNEFVPGDIHASSSENAVDRRTALTAGSTLLMAGGLTAGYGTFFAMAGRYLFPSTSDKVWMFVAAADAIRPGASYPFESPTGLHVAITRRDTANNPPTVDDFIALSSICPHLGCRVHWEPHNFRYYCPCHNGVFDADGKAVSGPPAADNQNLFQCPLKVVDGSLYIELPYHSVGRPA